MVRESPSNGENLSSEADLLQNPNNGETLKSRQSPCFSEEIDSACSTPYVSAPTSPGRGPSRYFYSAPASPMQFVLSSFASSSDFMSSSSSEQTVPGQVEFEFSARLCCNSWNAGSMSSAEELFLNGQIRPMKLSSHLQRPQVLTPLLDLDVEEEEEDGSREAEMVKREDSMVRGRDLRLRDRSLHRRSRSLSPLRNNAPFQWREEEDDQKECVMDQRDVEIEEQSEMESAEAAPSVSASSSRSSSSGRSSKRWAFLKDFLRSKSEGRGNAKDKYFWYSMSFSPAKEKKTQASHSKEKKTTEAHKPAKKNSVANPASSGGKGRSRQSPHELHYTANRAQAEEMKKRTYLPYRQGLLGCLGFSSKSYGAMNGFARALNPVSSR